jgi:multicomponent Na+:H+ antiporter subunit C
VSRADLHLVVALALVVLGTVRLLLTSDLIRRVLALNVAGAGVLMVLVVVAARSDPETPDPVPHALVLTGIVITVAVTAIALGLVRRVEALEAPPPPPDGPDRSDRAPDCPPEREGGGSAR